MWNSNIELDTKLRLLEKKARSFFSNIEPINWYYEGQSWYDKINKKVKIWDWYKYKLITPDQIALKYCSCTVLTVTSATTQVIMPISIYDSSWVSDFTITTANYLDVLKTWKYLISFSVKLVRISATRAICSIYLYKNNTVIQADKQTIVEPYWTSYLTITAIVDIVAGDTLDLKCLGQSPYITYFSAETKFHIISLDN